MQGSAIFYTSGPHSVLTRFQRTVTIQADQKRKVFAQNSGIFSVEFMAKTKKKRSSPKIQVFLRLNSWRTPKKKEILAKNLGLFLVEFMANTKTKTNKVFAKNSKNKVRIILAVCCCISIIEKRKRLRAG